LVISNIVSRKEIIRVMRLPLKDQSQFCTDLNSAYSKLQQVFYEKMNSLLHVSKIKVMLGDGTLTDTSSFDPKEMVLYFNLISKSLKKWASDGIMKSNSDDLHRISCQYYTQINKYFVSVFFGIQFHALRYYRVEKRVLEIQKEIFDLTKRCKDIRDSMADEGNKIISTELDRMGHADLRFEDLLDMILTDQSISRQLVSKTNNLLDEYPELRKSELRIENLHSELNDYIIETYTMEPAILDYNKLMQGEEGFVVYIDLETVTNRKSREHQSYVNFKNVDLEAKNIISNILEEMTKTIMV
jgi:hypothetical protein